MITISSLRKKITILLVVIFAACYSLPAEAHLKICIGDDGHFDGEVIACQTSALSNQSEPIIAFDDHHKECLDFETTCDNNFKCKALYFLQSQKVQRDISLTISNMLMKKMEEFFSSPVQRMSLLSFPHPLPKHNSLDALRSVILLI